MRASGGVGGGGGRPPPRPGVVLLIGARERGRRGQLAKRFGTSVVFDGRHNESAFRNVGCRNHVEPCHQTPRLDSAIEFARVDLAETDLQSLERLAELLRVLAALST